MEPAYEFQPEASWSFPGYESCWDPFADPVSGKLYCQGTRTDGSGIRDLLDAEGTVVREDCELPYPVIATGNWYAPWVWADRIACAENGAFCYYDLDGNCMFRRTIQTNLD